MMNMLAETFQRCSKPSNEFTIDEDVYTFKRRSILKQYLPNKPNKWGFRAWKLCDNSNYCFGFDVYQGKKDARQSTNDPTIGDKVVYNLITPIRANPKPLHLFMDNFYTSLRMMESLKKDAIHVTGTLRKNRVGMPKVQLDGKINAQSVGYFLAPEIRHCRYGMSGYEASFRCVNGFRN
jgi:hypothetical protein